MKKTGLLLLALLAASCTDKDGATQALEAAGYKAIQITGYRFFGCGKDDTYQTGFRAIGLNGKPVEGVVCAGMFMKGSTIRTF